jgi:hypothetical protein
MSLFFEEEAVAVRLLVLDKLNEAVTTSPAAAQEKQWLRESRSYKL